MFTDGNKPPASVAAALVLCTPDCPLEDSVGTWSPLSHGHLGPRGPRCTGAAFALGSLVG